jgi:two-component system LytT family response regulator
LATVFATAHRQFALRALGIRADGEYEVVLASAQRLRMSRRYRKSVLEGLTPT